MKAIWIKEWGDPGQLIVKEVPRPDVKEGEILIKVKAFGINHAESYFRQGLWGEVSRVTGIECVGEVEEDPTGGLKKGQTVAAVVGGLGRDRSGSYAEFVSALRTNVFTLDKRDLSWEHLAALPEVYATAWWCLMENLKLSKNETLLVRGATSSLGQAAINIAIDRGSRVLGTSRNAVGTTILKKLGANETFIEDANLSESIRKVYPDGLDAVFELIGSTTIKDSLKMAKKGGRVCMAGFLGGGGPVNSFNPLTDLPSGVDFNFFGSAFVLGTKDFPLEAIPMQQIVDKAAQGIYKSKPVKVFNFDEVPEAHRFMESGEARGKIVVRVS